MCCSFIHKTNTVEFKSATFPNAGSRHLLDDSVLESHTPTRGQAESSTLSSGISLGIIHTHTKLLVHGLDRSFLSIYVMILWFQEAVKGRSSVRRCLGLPLRGESSKTFPIANPVKDSYTRTYMTTCLSTYGHSMSWNMLESNVTLPAPHQPSLTETLPTLLFIIINLTQSLFSNTTFD